MEMSANFMESIDLQNGVFEEKGLQMLEQWEKESTLLLLDGKKSQTLERLNLNEIPQPLPRQASSGDEAGKYDKLFES
jgi:hypothetical protein